MTIEVRVKGHGMYYDYASEGPHKDRNTSVCVCVYVFWRPFPVKTQTFLGLVVLMGTKDLS